MICNNQTDEEIFVFNFKIRKRQTYKPIKVYDYNSNPQYDLLVGNAGFPNPFMLFLEVLK